MILFDIVYHPKLACFLRHIVYHALFLWALLPDLK